MNLHLVDISPLVYTGVAISNRKDFVGYFEEEGLETLYFNRGALQYLCRFLNKILADKNNKLVLFMDNKIEEKFNRLKNLIPNIDLSYYKQQRTHDKKSDVNIIRDFIRRIIRDLGIEYYDIFGYEADDLIYSYKFYNHYKYDKIYVYTQDCDMFMLVDNKTTIMPVNKRGRIITIDNYETTCFKESYCPWNLATIYRICFKEKDSIPHLDNSIKFNVWNSALAEPDKSIFGDVSKTMQWFTGVIKQPVSWVNLYLAMPIEVNEELFLYEKVKSMYNEFNDYVETGNSQYYKSILIDIFEEAYGKIR